MSVRSGISMQCARLAFQFGDISSAIYSAVMSATWESSKQGENLDISMWSCKASGYSFPMWDSIA